LPESWSPDSCKVNLTIILELESIETHNNLQVREAIKIIKDCKIDDVRFNLTFLNINEISKLLT